MIQGHRVSSEQYRVDFVRAAIVMLVAILNIGSLRAQVLWQQNGAPVCLETGDQVKQEVTATCKGGLLVVWEDMREPSNKNIYTQCLSQDGTSLWQFGGVAASLRTGEQKNPRIAAKSCQVYVVWEDYGGSASPDIYAQLFSPIGDRVWTDYGQFVAYSDGWANSANPEIVATSSGALNLAWEDWRGRESVLLEPYPGISCNQILPSGTRVFASEGVMVTNAGHRYSTRPVIAGDGGEGLFASWVRSSTKPASGNQAVMVSRVDGSGAVQWVSYAGGTMTTLRRNPRIANDGQTGCLVAWQDRRAGNWDIYAQRIDSQGSLKWGESALAIAASTNQEAYPVVASDGRSGAIVAWWDSTANDILAQRVDFAGNLLWGSGVVVCNASQAQTEPRIVSASLGGCIVVWTDERSGNKDIYFQELDSLGQAIHAQNGIVLCNAASDQLNPVISSDFQGGAVCAWTDYRFGGADIYAQRIGTAGSNYLCGNADSNSQIDISDAVWIVNYIFAGGNPPSPLASGDLDCSGIITITDAVYLINYIFAGGCRPCGV